MKGFQLKINRDNITYKVRFEQSSFDNYFVDCNEIVICLEGVLLNHTKLIERYNLSENYLHQLYKDFEKDFVKYLEGEFVGFVYDKHKKQLLAFTNFTATRKLLYYKDANNIIIDTSLIELTNCLKQENKNYSLDEIAMYQLLVCENTLEDYTPIKEVKKLNDAQILTIDLKNLDLDITSYYSPFPRFKGSKIEALKEIDRLFTQAVCLEFDKDKELNKETFALLSGGLDSRMTLMVALKNGYKIDEAFCFSQKNYWDEIIAKQIAKDYNIPFHFIALNGGEYITEIDEIFNVSNGFVVYSGALHTNFAYKSINRNRFGLIHSGQLGDGVFGMFNRKRKKTIPTKEKIVVHDRLFHRMEKEFNHIISQYDNEEHFLTRNVGYNRTVLGSYMAEEFSYQTSPFMNSDFLKFVHSLPEEWKYNQELYIEWINQYHPETTKYIWERTLLKPTSKKNTVLGDKIVKRSFNILINRIFKKQNFGKMTAYDYYYKQDKRHQEKMNDYFENTISFITSETLKNDLISLYKTGNFIEKTTVLTVLSIARHYL
ncbi:asparagine synthase-related protein [Empedobacter brevis]|uniref:asparagine synthase-related protein n=1 Tax=Empedobacter brevis TaxID=247 RepID=UPI0039B062F2